jgi:hypothetical protein
MLKYFFIIVFNLLFLQLIAVQQVCGQLKSMEPNEFAYTGSIVKEDQRISRLGSLEQSFRFNMSHQYSMSLMSGLGGGVTNMNAYTNLMNFGYGEKFSGQVALSFFHSPFGGLQNGALNTGASFSGVAISNAEINYHFNENFSVQMRFSQMPNQFGMPSSFNQNPFFGPNRRIFD